MTKEKDILNPCGHRNSERVEALMKFPSVCPACLLERIKKIETQLEQHRWIPVSEKLPKEGNCLVLCEGKSLTGRKIHEVKVRISEDEWEDNEGKSSLQETARCNIEHLGCILIGHDECITHWKPITLP